MSLVNQVLRRSHGAGMPHLVLDHLALRVTPAAYRKLFANAVEQYVVPGGTALSRHHELTARKRRAFAFIARVAAGSLAAASPCRRGPRAARLALFAA
jgi:hypothetical protein